MIAESSPWRRQLLADADLIDRWARKQKQTARRSYLLESKIFLAAYSIRKLIEAKKLTDAFADGTVRCKAYRGTGQKLTIANDHKLDELFDLSKPSKGTLGLKDFLDIVIHSLAFGFLGDDQERVLGILVTSPKRRRDLFGIDTLTITQTMRKAAASKPSRIVRAYDASLDDWYSWQGHGEPPIHVAKKLAAIRS